MNIIKNKKGVMSIAVLLLVLATLVLVIYSLFVFSIRSNSVQEYITSGVALEELYSRAVMLNFFLDDICYNVGSGGNAISEFRAGLNQYKDSNGAYITSIPYDLSQIESQLDGSHISYNGGLLKVNFNITMISTSYFADLSKGREFEVNYNYNYTCQRKLA